MRKRKGSRAFPSLITGVRLKRGEGEVALKGKESRVKEKRNLHGRLAKREREKKN